MHSFSLIEQGFILNSYLDQKNHVIPAKTVSETGLAISPISDPNIPQKRRGKVDPETPWGLGGDFSFSCV